MRTRIANLAFSVAIASSALPSAQANGIAESRREIERVVENFRAAIVDKDQKSFMGLFLRDEITWVAVIDDASLNAIVARRTDKRRPRPDKTFSGTPREFIETIGKEKGRSEETVDNLRIDTDGELAQVWFDYRFLRDGERQNWGKEAWQLVRTEAGWKIAAVTWSITLDPAPPIKPANK